MVLVDTSVWVDHLRRRDARLTALLESAQVLIHPFVIGELACGNLGRRQEILGALRALPAAPVARDAEVLDFIETHRLQGRGLGFIDMHLLASARLAGFPLWSADKRLAAVADTLALSPPER